MQGISRESATAAEERLEAVLSELRDADNRIGLSDGLFAATDLLDRALPLRRALADASAPADAKVALLDTVLGQQLAGPVRDLLEFLVRLRWARPGDLADTMEISAASAAFAAAEAAGAIDEVEDQLFRFGRIVDREPELRAALAGGMLPAEQRQALVDSLLTGRVHWVTKGLLERIVASPRGRSLDRALEEYARLAAQRRDRIVATVHLAVPMTPEQTDRMSRVLARIYGREVVLQVQIDPDVMGGVAVRVGDELIDGTVGSQLETAARGLTGR